MTSIKSFLLAGILAASLALMAFTTRDAQPALQVSQAGNSAGNPFTLNAGYTTATVSVKGGFTGTVNFEWSLDGTTYHPAECFSTADRKVTATTATIASGWRCNIVGYKYFQARTSGMASGTVSVLATFVSVGVM